jgi:hypothetical protein
MAILNGFPPSNTIQVGTRLPIEEGKAKVINICMSDGTVQLLLPDGTQQWASQRYKRKDYKLNSIPCKNEEVDYCKYRHFLTNGLPVSSYYYSLPCWKTIKEIKVLENIF